MDMREKYTSLAHLHCLVMTDQPTDRVIPGYSLANFVCEGIKSITLLDTCTNTK